MLSSRVCLQLLLGWALLLGQPVGGTDEVPEVEAETDTEAEAPSSSEGAEEPETSEEPLEEPYETIDDFWFMDPWSATEEQLEKVASMERMLLEHPKNYLIHSMRFACLDTVNENPQGPFYKLLEDVDLQTKKAIGSVSTFTLFVGTTNCSRAEGVASRSFNDHYLPWYWRQSLNDPSRPKCTLGPDPLMQQCKVYVYTDGETGSSSVFHTDCEDIRMEFEEPQTPLE